MKHTSKNISFEKRLMAYSLTAGALFACTGEASAQVTGESPGVSLTNSGDTFIISFNSEQKFRFGFNSTNKMIQTTTTSGVTNRQYTSSKSGWINKVTDSAKWIGYPGGGPDVLALNNSEVVSSPLNFKNNAANVNFFKTYNGGTSAGSAFVGQVKYIGVKFVLGGTTTHYGWISVTVNTGGAGYTIDSYAYEQTAGDPITANGALPVEFTSFSAVLSGTTALLEWQTATELDNYGFEVERNTYPDLKEGGTQTNQWQKIGFVPGSGNSNSPKAYSFTDPNTPSGLVMYRLKQIDNGGTTAYSDIVTVVNNAVTKFAVFQNFPNPFNPVTTIKYAIPEAGFVSLKVYDLLGTEAASLVNETKTAGSYTVQFDGSNLASGTYIYRLQSGSFTESKKLTLMK